ncbi:hypothetical protein GGX14DRAFT_452403 [Mycena pura]|uniref:Uncharacterized protein n=1 Tax=Mycena pura TaxID=153505 RepID=A0AAD6VEE5_9AGAR|nr:hypothetical protein GGX14DRAFT_452403 [Mycena pura]
MNDDRDLPPLPIPPPEAQVAESSRRHSHRSKDKSTTRELIVLLNLERREHRETQRELSRLTEQLRQQTLLAQEAQSQVLEATERLKNVNEARLVAVREAARANESLGLYKFQLETAQNEINRAQSVFNIVEAERYKAELAGAKSRTVARKLHEQQKVQLAREEGRRQGLQEGLEAGRLHVLTSDDPALSQFGDSQNFDYYDADFNSETPHSPRDSDASDLDDLYSPRTTTSAFPDVNDVRAPQAVPNLSATPDPVPIPTPVSTTAPRAAPATTALSPIFEPFHDIHPISVHNQVPHPRHERVDVPPDGYIPSTGPEPDSLPQIPPPHEFLRQAPIEEPIIRAMSPQSQRVLSVKAESIRRAPSSMPTHRMNTNLQGIERQHRSSFSSDFIGGGSSVQVPAQSNSSEPIPISVLPPTPESYTSLGHVGNPAMGGSLFGPGAANPRSSTHGSPQPYPIAPPVNIGNASVMSPAFVPLSFDGGPSTMPGGYAQAGLPEGVASPEQNAHRKKSRSRASESGSSTSTSTTNTLTTPPEIENRRAYLPD